MIFAAPEYTFAGVEDGARAPAEPLPVTQTSRLFNHLERLSASYPDWLLIPGSLLFKSGAKVQNRALGYFNGESVVFAGKAFGVGEVDESRGLTFVPGDGCGKATVGGMRVALQIFKDATVAETLTEKVDIHVTVGQGVGLQAIKTTVPSKVRIVASAGARASRGSGMPSVSRGRAVRRCPCRRSPRSCAR